MITDKSCGGSSTLKTLRDEFAGLAMQSILTDSEQMNTLMDVKGKDAFPFVAATAYRIADAMIAERNK